MVEDKQKQLQDLLNSVHETKEEMQLAWNNAKQLVKDIADLMETIRQILRVIDGIMFVLKALPFIPMI